MQISLMTDFALRILTCLAVSQDVITSKKIANQLGIPQKNVLSIGRKLKAENYLTIISGPYGGYLIAKEPEKVLLYDVVCLFERVKINCHSEKQKGIEPIVDNAMNHLYAELQGVIEENLKSRTLADLIGE